MALELVVAGLWSAVTPSVGRVLGIEVNTRPLVEVTDHLIPGSVVVVAALYALLSGRRRLWVSVVALAAGAWMVATHVPLLAQAMSGEVTAGAAVFHTLPGAVVLLLAVGSSIVDVLDFRGRPEGPASG
ncbi:MAG: hypothetical protein ACYDAC_09550 [Candidatus Dormibacteria bacterium]